jgi:predicted MFS family arabinose efflux permease
MGGLIVAAKMQPVAEHLKLGQEHSAFKHLLNTLIEPRYLLAFATTALVTTGGFMLMPLSSAFVVNNLKIELTSLPTLYFVTGLCTIFVGPMVGKASDAIGKFRVFLIGTVISIVMVITFTHLPPVPLYALVIVNSVMFVGIFSRVIPFQAIMSTIPAVQQRGSFNAINSATQQMAGGLASVIAGHIVTRHTDGTLGNIDVIGYVVAGSAVVALMLVWNLTRRTSASVGNTPAPATAATTAR